MCRPRRSLPGGGPSRRNFGDGNDRSYNARGTRGPRRPRSHHGQANLAESPNENGRGCERALPRHLTSWVDSSSPATRPERVRFCSPRVPGSKTSRSPGAVHPRPSGYEPPSTRPPGTSRHPPVRLHPADQGICRFRPKCLALRANRKFLFSGISLGWPGAWIRRMIRPNALRAIPQAPLGVAFRDGISGDQRFH